MILPSVLSLKSYQHLFHGNLIFTGYSWLCLCSNISWTNVDWKKKKDSNFPFCLFHLKKTRLFSFNLIRKEVETHMKSGVGENGSGFFLPVRNQATNGVFEVWGWNEPDGAHLSLFPLQISCVFPNWPSSAISNPRSEFPWASSSSHWEWNRVLNILVSFHYLLLSLLPPTGFRNEAASSQIINRELN